MMFTKILKPGFWLVGSTAGSQSEAMLENLFVEHVFSLLILVPDFLAYQCMIRHDIAVLVVNYGISNSALLEIP